MENEKGNVFEQLLDDTKEVSVFHRPDKFTVLIRLGFDTNILWKFASSINI